jgi:hypothetical protein
MRKTFLLLFVAVLTAAFILTAAGCVGTPPASPSASQSPGQAAPSGNESAAPSGDASPDASEEVSLDIPDAIPPLSSGTPSENTSSDPDISAAQDFFAIGDALMQSEGVGSVKINMTEADLVNALGQPDTKSTPQNWGSDGMDHSDWTYGAQGLKLNMAKVPGDASSIVFSIYAAAPCTLATQRSVKIGDSKDTVLTAYADSIDPSANTDTNTKIVIGSIYAGIIMTVENGLVKDIFIGASAE